jgi:SAM-dependent methyltransferase
MGRGQRVLEIGSGVGDVAMLAGGLVGPEGEVVGIERDGRSIARARARVAEAGFTNVSFTQCDVSQISVDELFDAVVGRFILGFLPDAADVLRSLTRLVRPGGIVAFHEASHAPFLALSSHLPLWFASASLAGEIVQRSGANTEMGPALHDVFQEAGLPAPTMHLEMVLGREPDFTRWTYDLLCSLRPQSEQVGLSLETLGDFDTLLARLQSEVADSNTVVPWVALVGAWSRKPTMNLTDAAHTLERERRLPNGLSRRRAPDDGANH